MSEVRPAIADDVPGMVDLHARVASEGLWIGTEAPVESHYRRRNGERWDAVLMALVLDDWSPASPHRDERRLTAEMQG